MSRTTTKIIIRRGNGEVVSQYALGIGEHLIGRESGSGIFIEDDHISRQHAKLIISADAIEIEDLKSTSGTFLDGMAVSGRIPVQPGQKVHISNLYMDIERAGFGELVKGARLSEGRFTLVEKLGQGGMGAVWKALDEESGAHVALKLLPPEMSSDPSGLRDLEREVEKTKYLNHRNIVQIGGLWHTEGEPAFITVEYVEGTDLNFIQNASVTKLLPWTQVQHYMLQLCDALEYAHSQRIAHRDIKPSNLLISHSGELKLADFGIAASIAGTTSHFTTDVISAGTPAYMAPQQIEGRRPQASDDIYSLGATFYELLTGTAPFYRGEIAHQVLHVPATPMEERLRELGTTNDIPDYVGAMVMACLQKDPDKRPVSAAAIHRWIESEGQAVDLEEGQRTVWKEEDTKAPTTRRLSKAAETTPPETLPAKSIVKGEGITKEKRSNVLAYGIAAAILAVVVGTAVILHEPGKSGSGKEGINQTSNVKIGTPIWEFVTGSYVHSSPAIGSDGTVYVGSGYPDKKLYAINPKSGVKLWEFETGDGVSSSPAIGSDGTVYVGSGDKKLYAIKTDSKGLAKSPWPMRGQNPQHTGRAPVATPKPNGK